MGLDLTEIKSTVNTLKRDLFYNDTYTIKFMNVNKLLCELTEGWYISKRPIQNLAIGAEYFEMSVVDVEDGLNLEPLIPLVTQVRVGNTEKYETYKIAQYFRPRGLTKEYKFRLESIGEKVSTNG